MANGNGNGNGDIVHAKLPISTVFTVGGFLIAQIIAFTYFGLIANHDYRLSNIEASVSIKVNSGNRYNPHDN